MDDGEESDDEQLNDSEEQPANRALLAINALFTSPPPPPLTKLCPPGFTAESWGEYRDDEFWPPLNEKLRARRASDKYQAEYQAERKRIIMRLFEPAPPPECVMIKGPGGLLETISRYSYGNAHMHRAWEETLNFTGADLEAILKAIRTRAAPIPAGTPPESFIALWGEAIVDAFGDEYRIRTRTQPTTGNITGLHVYRFKVKHNAAPEPWVAFATNTIATRQITTAGSSSTPLLLCNKDQAPVNQAHNPVGGESSLADCSDRSSSSNAGAVPMVVAGSSSQSVEGDGDDEIDVASAANSPAASQPRGQDLVGKHCKITDPGTGEFTLVDVVAHIRRTLYNVIPFGETLEEEMPIDCRKRVKIMGDAKVSQSSGRETRTRNETQRLGHNDRFGEGPARDWTSDGKKNANGKRPQTAGTGGSKNARECEKKCSECQFVGPVANRTVNCPKCHEKDALRSTGGGTSSAAPPADPTPVGGGRDEAPQDAAFDLETRLAALVGMESLKERLRVFKQKCADAITMLKNGQKPLAGATDYHMFLMGNAGTGKTTVARLLHKMLIAAGVLKPSAPYVEFKASDVEGQYMGDARTNTQEKINKARGGVLFADEAHKLTAEKDNMYGRQVAAALMDCLQDEGDQRVVVIYAGYPKEMKKLLESDQGYSRRIKHHFVLPDYKPMELAEIFVKKVFEQKRSLDEGVTVEWIGELIRERTDEAYISDRNGSIAEELLEKAEEAMCERTRRPDGTFPTLVYERQDIERWRLPKKTADEKEKAMAARTASG